jgi:hypothetical protein
MTVFACPCCDHFTLKERGLYEICPVCFWEDSGPDLDRMDESSGNNSGLTLRQARENFRRLGACESSMFRNVCSSGQRAAFRHEPRD